MTAAERATAEGDGDFEGSGEVSRETHRGVQLKVGQNIWTATDVAPSFNRLRNLGQIVTRPGAVYSHRFRGLFCVRSLARQADTMCALVTAKRVYESASLINHRFTRH